MKAVQQGLTSYHAIHFSYPQVQVLNSTIENAEKIIFYRVPYKSIQAPWEWSITTKLTQMLGMGEIWETKGELYKSQRPRELLDVASVSTDGGRKWV